MYYICIENGKIVSVLDYEPNVPETVRVVPITDEDNKKILEKTHVFNIELNRVVPMSADKVAEIGEVTASIENFNFLNNSDWKVLRHIRQKALGLATSLTEAEYIELERQRQIASTAVKKPPSA